MCRFYFRLSENDCTTCEKKLKKSAERQKNYYDRAMHEHKYQEGDLVWVMNKARKKGVSPKLSEKWRGPCVLTRVYNNMLVEVQVSTKKSTTYHVDLLQPCHSTRRPRWVARLVARIKKGHQKDGSGLP